VAELLGSAAGRRPDRLVVAVDGRSGAGKTTLARRLGSCVADAAVISTDDISWNAPMFRWAPLAAAGVLSPFRAGRAVRYRPPEWEAQARPGHLEVPEHVLVLVLEGVGAAQRALCDLIDVTIWVQSDFSTAERLGIARDIASGVNGDETQSVAFWQAWMAAEITFLQRDRPWERADVVVAGVGGDVDDPEHVEIAPPPTHG
jgi:hypothetical protein